MEIVLYFRKKLPQFNSMEEVFCRILPIIKKSLNVQSIEMPCSGASTISIFKNLKLAFNGNKRLVHITGHDNYLALVTGRKTILTIHDIGSSFNGNLLRDWLLRLFWYKIPALLVSRITVISKSSASEVIKMLPFARNKICIIHNPLSTKLVFSHKPFQQKKPTILHLGTKPNKNLERTIEALSEISCHFVIIGKLTSTQQELLNRYKIEYTNEFNLPFERIIEHYQQCDLVSFVSTYEGFGMPIIEAQAVGRPVITSLISSMPEVAGDSAHLVDPFDVGSIRQGILKIIEDVNYREELIEKGLINIQRFQPEIIAQQYIDIYKEIWYET